MKIAVVGSGISGLAATWALSEWADVTVFEADERLGGHTHTQYIQQEGIQFPVDTGFIVFNERTYPGLIQWLAMLGVDTAPSDMSFSASLNAGELEWCGSHLGTVFAQRSNLVSPRFWKMLADIVRFNREAPRYAHNIRGTAEENQSLGSYLDQHHFGGLFLDAYLLPMAGAIWSCPTEQMRAFPMATFTRFCENHGLLSLSNRPQWMTIRGGAQSYIEAVKNKLPTRHGAVSFKTGHAVQEIQPGSPVLAEGHKSLRVAGISHKGTSGSQPFAESFDAVLIASHSDQSAQMLSTHLPITAAALKKIGYQENVAYLHTDLDLMPKRKRAWASWNYLHRTGSQKTQGVSVTYWMNRLQPLPVKTPVLVSLNPVQPPRDEKIINVMRYAHPVFDGPAVQAQKTVHELQGQGGVWLAGAWTRYGFHEDGFQSGINAAALMKERLCSAHSGLAYAHAA